MNCVCVCVIFLFYIVFSKKEINNFDDHAVGEEEEQAESSVEDPEDSDS